MSDVLDRDHICFDLETLSTNQRGMIVSIGACKFRFDTGISDKFAVNLSTKDSSLYDKHVSKDTLIWWQDQPKEIRDSWRKDPVTVMEALDKFDAFFGYNKKQMIWSQGTYFDCGLLKDTYDVCNRKEPWEFWNIMDARTIFNLVGVRFKNKSNAHSALDDAIATAELLIKTLNSKE